MILIPLNHEQYAIIDDEDIKLINRYKWYYINGYAIGSEYNKITKKSKTCYMHRIVMDAKKGQYIDHINHNGLDNQKKNLRLVTMTQNLHNRIKHIKNCSTSFKGVHWATHAKKFRARITIKKQIHLGYFDTAEEAARAYDKAAYANDPIHCHLNFPRS